MLKWEYENSILQISGSLHRWYGLERGHGSDPETDRYLETYRPRCVIALLIDAMGTEVLKAHLPEDSFFRRHLIKSVSTVFPTATTAATTAFLTGRSPAENGWLGWNQYFQEEDDNVILFRNMSQYGPGIYPPGWSEKTLPVVKIYDALTKKGIKADSVWPGWSFHNACGTFDELLDTALSLSAENEFLYVYWDDLDTFMHRNGMHAAKTGRLLAELDRKTAAFAGKLPEDVVLLVIADHGMTDVTPVDISSDAYLCSMFRHDPALEPRAAAFYIRAGKEAEFAAYFRSLYGDDYILADRAAVISSQLFGKGKPAERFAEFTGDYIAIAHGDKEIRYRPRSDVKGDHAGITDEEKQIPLILYCSKKHE